MESGFWTVAVEDGRSVWKWQEVTYLPRGTARFSNPITFGRTEFKAEEPRDWNDVHGCPTIFDMNLQIFEEGAIQVDVGGVIKCFGPGQTDGNKVAFMDCLEIAQFANGHRTKVISATRVTVCYIHRQQGGD